MKLALVISSLEGGGAERVMARLANAWRENGHQVTLITMSKPATDDYPLSAGIKRVALGLTRPSNNLARAIVKNLRRLRALRKEFRVFDPDAVISFQTNTNILVVLANIGTRRPVIVSERISVEDHSLSRMWQFACLPAYRQASAVVAQTKRIATWMEHRFGITVHVIPNPVPSDLPNVVVTNRTKPGQTENKPTILAMGRLDRQKGFDLLLDAFGRLARSYPDWSLVILGEGRERTALENQVAKLGLRRRVIMPGFVNDPEVYLQRAAIFALSSRYEGMPNALLEAMAMGLPCISFDCRTGPAELIEHDVNGLLVSPGDVGALAEGLSRLMSDPQLRTRLGEKAVAVRERFSIDAVIAQWDAVLAIATARRAGASRRQSAAGYAT